MKHYLIYQIRNKLNNMIYIGQHQTENLDDGYMGSGLRIQRAIEKYGIDNFEKTILFECNSEEEMNQKEAEIVNEDFIARDDVYNIVPGGWGGGFKALSFEDKSKASKKRWQNMTEEQKRQIADKVRNFQLHRKWTKESRNNLSDSLKEAYKRDPSKWGMTGKHASDETKEKMSNAAKGSNNSNFGCHWWKDPNDKTKCLSIKEGDPVPEGWIRGKWQSFSADGLKRVREAGKRTVDKMNKANFERNKEKFVPILKEYKAYLLEHTWTEFVKHFNYKHSKKYLFERFKMYMV